MVRAGICYLITEEQGARGVFDRPEPVRRKVFCTERSVFSSEYYNAHNQGMQPEMVLKLKAEKEYKGELLLEYKGLQYTIIRQYVTPDGGIELTIQRSDVNA
jgi:hypothetical protein